MENWYNSFNAVEAVLWMVVASVIVFRTPVASKQQRAGAYLAGVAFVAFGGTDLLELGRDGRLPWWLWCCKIVCGCAILAARYTWLGWNRFRYTDREFLFGLGCLIAVLIVILVQNYVER